MIAATIASTTPCVGVRSQTRLFALRSKSSTTTSFKGNALSTFAPKRKSACSIVAGSRNLAIMVSASGKLSTGDKLTSAALVTNEGKEVNLAELAKDQGVVIFSYPKAATSGCTVQACGFRDNYDLIRKAGFDVYGLSLDAPEDQSAWKNKESLQYELLTDTSGDALKALGAFKEPNSVVRSHFVIAKGGEILLLENGVKSGESFGCVVDFINNLKN